MNWVDWALLLILLISLVIGLWRGLVYEVMSVLAWVAAFVVAQAFAGEVGGWLPMGGASPGLQTAAGFVLVFVVAAFAGGFVAWLVKKMVESVGLRPIDRVLGAGFGLARGAIILLALTLVVNMTPLVAEQWWQESVGAKMLTLTLYSVKPLLPDVVAAQLP